MTGVRAAVVGAILVHGLAGPPPVGAAAAQDGCALRIEARTRNSVGAPGAQGVYTTHLGGGTVSIRCGGALMTGDSAVHYESESRAEMIGEVAYRDTARTLSADRLTYFEESSQVAAAGDVELVRLSTGARLEGPRVSFFRAGSLGGRTLATGRPHMTIPAAGGGEDIEVDADEAEFIGDSVSIGRGSVEIRRSDFDATADSAIFVADLGRLFGRPVVTARGMRLEGDSIRAGLVAGGGLDRLHASGRARGTGESLELAAAEILVAWGVTDVERIEAFGEGRSLAASETFLVAGDSLDFALTAGAPDSMTAVGSARTFQLAEPRAPGMVLEEPPADLSGDRSWIEGDRIRAWLEPAGGAQPGPAGANGEGAPAGGDRPATRVRRLRATDGARSYFSAVRDSAESRRPSRNYLIGEAIVIEFADGEPVGVTADKAIGVFLEPTNAPAANSAEAVVPSAADSAASPPADSAAPPAAGNP